MTILVDNRAGSKELYPLLKPAKLTRMQFGDVMFMGDGPDGRPVPIGIEHKTLADVLKCITDARFAGVQLPGLVSNYEYVYLVIQGLHRPCHKTGRLLVPRKKRGKLVWEPVQLGYRAYTWNDLESWLTTMEVKAGVVVRRCNNRQDSALFIQGLYRWWTAKGWDRHMAHLQFHQPEVDKMLLTRPTLLRRIAAQIPGIGWTKSAAVEEHFGSVLNMVMANVEDWQEIPGIGKKLAKDSVDALS
jgi:ERCC4-type nuclease